MRQHQFNFLRRLSWSISSNFGENSLLICTSQPKIAKKLTKTPYFCPPPRRRYCLLMKLTSSLRLCPDEKTGPFALRIITLSSGLSTSWVRCSLTDSIIARDNALLTTHIQPLETTHEVAHCAATWRIQKHHHHHHHCKRQRIPNHTHSTTGNYSRGSTLCCHLANTKTSSSSSSLQETTHS